MLHAKNDERLMLDMPQERLAYESASSTTSTQCLTGIWVPLCKCWMQPMLADTIACTFKGSRLPSLRSRKAYAISG